MSPLVVSLVFFALAVGLLVADLFLPSAGVVLVLSLICAAASILFGFRHSYSFGMGLLMVELALVPLMAWMFVKLWPKTPLGRRMIIEPKEAAAYEWEEGSLVGREGMTTCDLVPSGAIDIDGRSWDATSRVGLIASGRKVKVVDEEMGQLFVVPAASFTSEPRGNPTFHPTSGSPLDRPADDLGIDSL